MLSLLLAVLLSCPSATWINQTPEPWNKKDNKIFNKYIKRCPEVYKDAPCLKIFIKKYSISNDGSIHYHVICGAAKKGMII